jgi:hypothetical protein
MRGADGVRASDRQRARPSDQLRTQQRASITLGDLALSRDLPVSIDMLDAIDWLAEAFGKEGYHLESAGDIARCSRARRTSEGRIDQTNN